MLGFKERNNTVNEIVNGRRAISAEVAVKLEFVFKMPAKLWKGLQDDYDIGMARLKVKEEHLTLRVAEKQHA
ncbi:putative plasmid maintenance system antidote protein, XRE family [Magnetococcus marinus MC-1]|uniref:Putative plasmid maintenance system antidote protein, XRE family n=1 Tax=Magnetococcus marinus (strain ATCC BAA-1437 / JCM 17883 / MC-1) TaxID=156889 RepID=A0L4L5_MAGMM|nr:putative plasmid maintenance system antidote protein, XRE family [Magnetococcus marinus MC-1]